MSDPWSVRHLANEEAYYDYVQAWLDELLQVGLTTSEQQAERAKELALADHDSWIAEVEAEVALDLALALARENSAQAEQDALLEHADLVAQLAALTPSPSSDWLTELTTLVSAGYSSAPFSEIQVGPAPGSKYSSSDVAFLEPPEQVGTIWESPEPGALPIGPDGLPMLDPDTLVQKLPLPLTTAQIEELNRLAREAAMPNISSAQIRANALEDTTGPGWLQEYAYYLRNPSAMDRDLELAFYTSLAVSAVSLTAAGGLVMAGYGALTVGQASTAAAGAATRTGQFIWNAAQNPMVREGAKELGKQILREGVRHIRNEAFDNAYRAVTGREESIMGVISSARGARNAWKNWRNGPADRVLHAAKPGGKGKDLAKDLTKGNNRGSASGRKGGVGTTTAAELEQPRDNRGRFTSRTHPGQANPGSTAVDDFAAQAQRNGFDVVGRQISVNTPFGRRVYDLVIRNRATGAVTGVEIKSSQSSFRRFDKHARQQFAADRWLRSQGGLDAVGKAKGLFIPNAIKILWEIP